MAGAYDLETSTVIWGTGNPAPLYDWAGLMEDTGRDPGTTSTPSVIGARPGRWQRKTYFQELPHDAWDFDDSHRRFVFLERTAKVHRPSKQGRFRVCLDRRLLVLRTLAAGDEHQLHRRVSTPGVSDWPTRSWREASTQNLCPCNRRGSAGIRLVQPKYRHVLQGGARMVMDLEIVRTTPVLEPMAQLNAEATSRSPTTWEVKCVRTRRRADPITGQDRGKSTFSSRLCKSAIDGGNLLFVPDRAALHAYNATTIGEGLWSCYTTASVTNGGIISRYRQGQAGTSP